MIIWLGAVIGVNAAYVVFPWTDWNVQVLFWSLAYLLFQAGTTYELSRRR